MVYHTRPYWAHSLQPNVSSLSQSRQNWRYEYLLKIGPSISTLLRLHVDAIFQLDIHKSTNFKGYTALLGENTNPENRGDLHEGFDLGWEDLESGTVRSSEDDGSMAGENVWPDDTILPGFRRAVLEY